MEGSSRGKGKVFCGGGDLRTMGPEISSIEMKERMDITTKIFLQIYNMNKPVIAAVQGYAVGAGFSLALAADILFAEEDAKFGLVFNKVGLIPDAGAHYFIKKVVGPWKAKELIWTGAMITAEEGERLGFVNRVVPKGESYESAYKFATEIATGPVNAFRYTKSIINSELDLQETMKTESFAQSILIETEDHREGVKAFFEKRKPKFVGN